MSTTASTTTKHTPSPWLSRGWKITGLTAAADYTATEAVKEALPEVFVRTVGQAAEAGKAAVCTVYGMSAEEAEGNARLLAAAPELRDALREIVKNDPFKQSSAGIIARGALDAAGLA